MNSIIDPMFWHDLPENIVSVMYQNIFWQVMSKQGVNNAMSTENGEVVDIIVPSVVAYSLAYFWKMFKNDKSKSRYWTRSAEHSSAKKK